MTERNRGWSLLATAAIGLAAASSAQAHDMWVNATAAHDPDADAVAVVTSIGWGHLPLPIAEFIAGERLESYAIVAPDGAIMALPFDPAANAEVETTLGPDALAGLAEIQAGDPFARRLIFDADAQSGAWRAHAAVPARVYSTWIDAAGEVQSGAKFADEIEGATEVVSSAVTVRAADTFWVVGDWSTPTPTDAPLQLIPASDPSSAEAGETLLFAIYRDGERMSAPADAVVAAFSESGEAMGAVDANGDLSIALPTSGTWVVRSSHRETLAEAGPTYADLEGRIDAITFTATTVIDVNPASGT